MDDDNQRLQRTREQVQQQQPSSLKRRRLLKTLGVATGAAALPIGTAAASRGTQKSAGGPPVDDPVHVFELDTTGYDNLATVYAKVYPGAEVEFEVEGNFPENGSPVAYEVVLHNAFNSAGKFMPGRATAEISSTEVPERPLDGGEESGRAVQESDTGAK